MNKKNITKVVGSKFAKYCEYATEMEYHNKGVSNCLARGKYKGIPFIALNIKGVNPTGYVNVSKTKFNKKKYRLIPVSCHCGLTYSEDNLWLTGDTGWWIGWDYLHYGDYDPRCAEESGQQYTTKEVVNECINVIEQIVKLNKAK